MVIGLWSPHAFSFPFCLELGYESDTFSELESFEEVRGDKENFIKVLDFTKLAIVSWLFCFCSSVEDCLEVISSEFLRLRDGVEKALLLNSLMPSLMILREVSFLMRIVSLSFNTI